MGGGATWVPIHPVGHASPATQIKDKTTEVKKNMAKRRLSGDGIVRKREDGRWEGRFVIGHKENGEPIFRYIYADTQKELTAKL